MSYIYKKIIFKCWKLFSIIIIKEGVFCTILYFYINFCVLKVVLHFIVPYQNIFSYNVMSKIDWHPILPCQSCALSYFKSSILSSLALYLFYFSTWPDFSFKEFSIVYILMFTYILSWNFHDILCIAVLKMYFLRIHFFQNLCLLS